MKNWGEIKTESDLYKLCRYGKIDYRAFELYEKIEDELINTFGLSNEYKKQLKLRIQIELIYSKMFQTGDKSLKLLAITLERELARFDTKPSKHNLHDSIIAMNTQGINVDINTITVYDFYSFSESFSKLNK